MNHSPTYRDLSVFPGLLPDECIWGYLVRVVYLNRGRKTHSSDQLTGSQGNHWVSGPLFPTRMDYAIERYPHIFGTLPKLAQDHTILPLLTWTMDAQGLATVMERFVNGVGQNPSLLALGVLAGYPRHCASCADDDRRLYGVAYWRRSHQLGFVRYCGEHETPLLAGCGGCLHNNLVTAKFGLPDEKCVCGRAQVSLVLNPLDPHRHLFLGMSRIAREAMQMAEPACVREADTRAIATELTKRRITHQGRPSQSGLLRYLNSTGTLGGLDKLGLIGTGLPAVRSLLLGKRSENLGLRIAVIAQLFGGLLRYVEACQEAASTAATRGPSEAAIDEARATILAAIEKYGTNSRAVIGRKASEAVKVLFNFDNSWYESHVPRIIPNRQGQKLRRPMPDRLVRRDELIAAEIATRAVALRAESGEPRRLTRGALVAGIRAGRVFQGPLTTKALAENVESTREYGARCVNWAARTPQAFTSPNRAQSYIQNRMGIGSGARLAEIFARGDEACACDMLADHPGPGSLRKRARESGTT